MAIFVKGDVVIVPFPFSDLSNSKRRPSLVVAELNGDDLILCQITSRSLKDNYSIELNNDDFENGNLNQNSSIRPNRIFTADSHIILYKVGSLKKNKTSEVINKIIEIIK
ncbi:MAG: type II toxin-antitoxin system PemK/MazF family toxin [Candidatus Sericytochromatia bacterium]|nr:type II toxin-antitoxin system PemK/MazF family toxin [Candidatus Sericytochromatia bacterium]